MASELLRRDLTDAPPVSELFLSCFPRMGQYTGTCDFCGRVHFAGKEGPDHDTLPEMRKAAANSDRYIEHTGMNAVMMVDINGLIFVEGCPCNNPRRMEAFVLNNRGAIIDFLRAYAADQLAAMTQVIADLDDSGIDGGGLQTEDKDSHLA